MKRYIYIILLLIAFTEETKAQENTTSSTINKTANTTEVTSTEKNYLLKDCSFGFGLGLTQFHGDISEDKDAKAAFSMNIVMPLQGQNYIQAEFIKGSIYGKNPSFSFYNPRHTIQGVPVQNLKEGERFNMEFMEFDINLLINLSVLFNGIIEQIRSIETGPSSKAKTQKLDFLCKVGVGLNMFRSLRQELTSEQFINSYGYEWMWENDFEHAGTLKSDYVRERVFVLGMIIKHKISKKLDIDFSVTSRIGNTDKWDAKLSGKDDMFMFYSLGTTYKFGKD